MSEYIFIVANAIAYVVLFILYYKKVQHVNTGVILLFIWAISAVGSILYEPVNFIGHNNKITLIPYIYLFIANFIMFYPILSFKPELVKTLSINTYIFKRLCLIILLLSILPFTENCIYATSHMNQSGMEELQMLMNERYEDPSITYAYLSRPALICTRILGFIGINILSLMLILFPIILPIQKNKLLFGGIILANANYMLEGINIFARFKIIIQILMIIFIFVMFKDFYKEKLRKIVLRYAFITFGAISFIFMAITVHRLNNIQEKSDAYNISMFTYIGQYSSESMGNFNANMWAATKHTNMDRFKYAIMRNFNNIKRDRQTESFYLGYNSGQFYTAVGDYFRAYGSYITLIIIIIPAWIFTRIYKNKQKLTLSGAILFLLYARMPLLGFTYNSYAVSSDEFIFTLLLLPLLFLYENSHKKLIINKEY